VIGVNSRRATSALCPPSRLEAGGVLAGSVSVADVVSLSRRRRYKLEALGDARVVPPVGRANKRRASQVRGMFV